jgi:hypothetical protein
MSNVDEIEKQIRELPRDELARLREWFLEFDAEAWDHQIAADLAAGRLDDLLTEAQNDLQAGRLRER